MSGETRMLERRVSNNRSDLNADQQMNYFLSWFTTWSDLQKTDFVSVLAGKMKGDKALAVNGLPDLMAKTKLSNGTRPPSLFSCQVKLFDDWFSGWSDDQKNYLALRLKDIDGAFFEKYENYLQFGQDSIEKDFFEPGIPEDMIKHSNGGVIPHLVGLNQVLEDQQEEEDYQEDEPDHGSNDLSDDDDHDDPKKQNHLYRAELAEPVPEIV
ncbi:hypothetical protein TCAL_09605 [Tigriopus californicus]|uniref:Uncharacterized protein n=2 Tax=Tigriopus californicus TaxID=6832 RepID=A0A553P4S9_TIGCA|nr:hypothetical protein TCAL_09605 [Tigriopus californicus]|eukprot:TCALIF_09605-PA protein Name:"Similar to MNCb-2990 Uncharacterized protein C14orf119 homolog (Mus musculus)" AED:0.25 eAED:0.25 QI:0/-1/0/1/-1/1/1/0/210